MRIDIKAPGLDDKVESGLLQFHYPTEKAVDGYERLLYDAISKDQSHFVHSEEVLESWRIVDDLLCIGDKCPVRTVPYVYFPGLLGTNTQSQFNH